MVLYFYQGKFMYIFYMDKIKQSLIEKFHTIEMDE